MSAIIRNGYPVIHSAIVAEEQGLKGGEFVKLDFENNTVTKTNSDFLPGIYLTVNVTRDTNTVGDDADTVVPQGGLIGIVGYRAGDEYIITDIEGEIGESVQGSLTIVDKLIYNGRNAVAVRCDMPGVA